jgi:ABC-2 type transport system ATP-binding protein
VAILNHGKLVALAPIEELLAGSQDTIYSLVIEGDAGLAQERVGSQAWVGDIEAFTEDDVTTWKVAVTDEAAAKEQLLRLVLSDEHITVTHFGKKTYELEEIFMNIVEGDNHG